MDIDRLQRTRDKGIYPKQQLKDKLIEQKQYIDKHSCWKCDFRKAPDP